MGRSSDGQALAQQRKREAETPVLAMARLMVIAKWLLSWVTGRRLAGLGGPAWHTGLGEVQTRRAAISPAIGP